MHLTPDILEATYELLRLTAPFKRWKLPHADDLGFEVSNHAGVFGSFHFDDEKPGKERISISVHHVNTLSLLMQTMAHEMCHLRELQLSIKRANRANHGKTFNRLADQVCRRHGFDRGSF